MNVKDNRIAVVVLDTDVIRATFGLQEYLARPAITMKACYAISKAPAQDDGDANGRSGWLVGEELEKAQKEGSSRMDSMEVRWPFRSSKAVDDWEGREFILTHVATLLGIKIPNNTSPLLLVPPSSPSGLPLSTQALYTQLAFESLNVPGLSILPSSLASLLALNATTGIILHVGRESCEIVVVTDSVVRWETATTVKTGIADCEAWLEELLLDDQHLDSQLRELASEGKSETEAWRSNPRRRELVREVVRVVFDECAGDDVEIVHSGGHKAVAPVIADDDEGTFDVAKKLIGETPTQQAASHKSKKQLTAIQAAASKAATDAANKAAADAVAIAAADIIVFSVPSFPEKEITLGPIRHRLAEPLFQGTNGGDTVWEGVGRALESEGLSTAERVAAWEAVVVTGELAKFKSLAPALLTYIAPLLLSSSEIPSDIQSARARLLSIPDYFTNFKGVTNDEAPFLGASMVAKVAFSEYAGKHYITKVDYNAKGPAAIYAVSGDN